jgi:hypothetical protein
MIVISISKEKKEKERKNECTGLFRRTICKAESVKDI